MSIVHERKRQEETLEGASFVPSPQTAPHPLSTQQEPLTISVLQTLLRDKRSTLHQESQWTELAQRYGVSRSDLALLCKYVNIPETVSSSRNGEESSGNHQPSLVQDAEWIENLLEKSRKSS